MSADHRKYFQKLKALFLDFFKYLYTSREIFTVSHELYEISLRLYSQLSAASDGSWGLSFDPPWAFDIIEDKYFNETRAAYLLVGGALEVENFSFKRYDFSVSIIRNSQSSMKTKRMLVSCCEKQHKRESRIVRRFHFDTGKGKLENYESSSHMQFGGLSDQDKIAVKEKENASLHYCLDNLIDIPRFPYPPIDIIVLLDILLRQFKTLIDRSFYETRTWLDLVSRSENFRLWSYYEQIHEYFEQKGKNRENTQNRTLLEFLCGEDCTF
jgi:hypothetical protein